MNVCRFDVRRTFAAIILVEFAILEYSIGTTVSNVALGKPATQTDTAGGANASFAVDGNKTTCSKTESYTAEWEIDLNDYHLLKELSIHDVKSLTYMWPPNANGPNFGRDNPYDDGLRANTITSLILQIIGSNDAFILLQNNNNDFSNNIVEICLGGWDNTQSVIRHIHHGNPSSTYPGALLSSSLYQWFWVSWNDGCVKVGKGFTVNGSQIMQWCGLSYNITGIRFSFAYGNGGTFIIPLPPIEAKSYKVKMGLTHGMYEAEEIMNTSTIGQASLSLSDKGPYRHVRIQANQENETLTLCEIQIKGNPQPRTPLFRTVTGIAMSNPAVRTYFNVKNVIMCTSICLRQTEPACLAAQFYQATESCTLFNGFEHTIDPSNSYTTVVFDFAAHFF